MAGLLHSFVICAYKDSPYLEDLIACLRAQTTQSPIAIATSTPTDGVREIAARHGLPLHVNPTAAGIAGDWNFAYETAGTDLVTLAHQDDVYEPVFTERTLAAYARHPDAVLCYTDYFEIRPEGRVYANKLLRIKRAMNAPIGWFPRSRWVRNRMLSLGCPISCPAVTYHKARFPDFRFTDVYKNDLDWEAWYRLARESGAFLYVREPLLGHRIHEGSETTHSIRSGVRAAEDLDMFRKYWPDGIARAIHRAYSGGMKSNETA
ncbi:MAG: glycosyltransferase family 2 protein [Clostridiales Family XIII bacterium]|jgi:glycosyltransferase involved in cell wall biosynthesis|nr:glycosyltransferase family 2 protein [Clostridiales Family XIII bacterium]